MRTAASRKLPQVLITQTQGNSPQSFADGLLRLIESEELRQEMSEKGWDHVREKFHYTRLTADMSALYSSLSKNQVL